MDAKLFNTEDGGEIEITADGLTTTDGLETAVYLSLFGAPSDWWGNSLFDDEPERYTGEFVKLRDALSATPGNLRRMETAALADLKGIPADNITVTASLVGVDRVKLVVDIDETRLEFSENWDAMRVNIGGAVAAAPARLPEYLTGLRVLIKDGVNIAPDPATLTAPPFTSVDYNVSAPSFAVEITANGLIYNKDTQPISMSIFHPFGSTNTVALKGSGATANTARLLFRNSGKVDFYPYFPATSTVVELRPTLAHTGYLFGAMVIENETVKVYLNTAVDNTISDTLRLVYSQPIADTGFSGYGYPFYRVELGSNLDKLSAWNTALSLETLQSWYDLGPTGDPL